MDVDKLLTDKFLQKCKDRALDHKLEPIPYGQEELWIARLWCKGVISTLIANGFKITKEEA